MTNHQRGADETIARVLELHEQAKAAGFGMTVQNWEYSEYVNTHAPALARTLAAVTTERDALAERERALVEAIREVPLDKEMITGLVIYQAIVDFFVLSPDVKPRHVEDIRARTTALAEAISAITAAHTTGAEDE